MNMKQKRLDIRRWKIRNEGSAVIPVTEIPAEVLKEIVETAVEEAEEEKKYTPVAKKKKSHYNDD